MDNFIEMTFEEADEQFKFMVNNYDEYSSFDGLMFETYGDEVEYVKSISPDRIWMYGDGDDGGTYIWSGWGFVNRLGYFISEKPVPPNTKIQIKVAPYWYYCEGCGLEQEDDGQLINDKFYEFECCPQCATVEQLKEIEEKE
jgi:hypothetical protein